MLVEVAVVPLVLVVMDGIQEVVRMEVVDQVERQ
tara:strand:+ start:176 stop:277 length:102 start_codon:yes stop_codon:yes gene_type:complete